MKHHKYIIFFCIFSFIPFIAMNNESTDKQKSSNVIAYFSSPKVSNILHELKVFSPEASMDKRKELFTTMLFKNPNWRSIDFDQPAIYLFLNTKLFKNTFFYSIHLKDADQFFANFGKGLLDSEAYQLMNAKPANHIKEYIEERIQFDKKAFLTALKNGEKINPENFQKTYTQSYYVYQKNDLLLVSGDLGFLENMTNDLEQLHLYHNDNTDLTFFFELEAFRDSLRKSFGTFSKIIESEYLNQEQSKVIQAMRIDLTITETHVNIHFIITAIPQSEILALAHTDIGQLISTGSLSNILKNLLPLTITKDENNANTYMIQYKQNENNPSYILYYTFKKRMHIFSTQALDVSKDIKTSGDPIENNQISIYLEIPKQSITPNLQETPITND